MGFVIVFTFTLVVITMFMFGGFDDAYLMYNISGIRTGYVLQTVIFITAGIHLLLLPFLDLWRSRNADSLLLLLLILGIFIFSAFVNWTTNGRSLLPMVPAVAILVVRQLEATRPTFTTPTLLASPLLLAATLSLLVTYGDYLYACSARQAAREIQQHLTNSSGTAWAERHWGFQYYTEKSGFKSVNYAPFDSVRRNGGPLDLQLIQVMPGDTITFWESHRVLPLSDDFIASTQEFTAVNRPWISTINRKEGAGFYSSTYGMLPYYFGSTEAERFLLCTIKK